MVTYEQAEKVETGLDVAIMSEDGRILAWAYSEDMAKSIVDALNNCGCKDSEPLNSAGA